jgi:hypothetical protein
MPPVRPNGVGGIKTRRPRLEAVQSSPVLAPAAPSKRDDIDLVLDQHLRRALRQHAIRGVAQRGKLDTLVGTTLTEPLRH